MSAEADRLIHDAEHAEAGAEFARMMARNDPANPVHADMARNLEIKAQTLRAEAARLKR